MNTIKMSSSDLLESPIVEPSHKNVIYSKEMAGDSGRLVLPLYKGIAVGDSVNTALITDRWGGHGKITITSTTVPAQIKLASALFSGATTARAFYIVEGKGASAEAVYTVVDAP